MTPADCAHESTSPLSGGRAVCEVCAEILSRDEVGRRRQRERLAEVRAILRRGRAS